MKVVIDTNYVINREIPNQGITHAYIPSSVEREVKDKLSQNYLTFYTFMITVKDPSEEYIRLVKEKVGDSLLYLSQADIDVVALTLELSGNFTEVWIGPDNFEDQGRVLCLSKDNGIRMALCLFGLFNRADYQDRRFMLRCYACSQMYDKLTDFCANCGYNTITRVSVIEGDKVCLKKNYQPRPKTLRSRNGVPIVSADQKEYAQYLKDLERDTKKRSNIKFLE